LPGIPDDQEDDDDGDGVPDYLDKDDDNDGKMIANFNLIILSKLY
jgi:hypothetical protein